MGTPIRDRQQQKITGGKQTIILDPAETAETDELDPKFDAQTAGKIQNVKKPEPGDDPSTELI